MSRLKKAVDIAAAILLVFQLTGSVSLAQSSANTERVLIRTPKPYTRVVDGIRSLGGRVKHEYKHVDAIAAEIPQSAMPAVRNLVGMNAITKDTEVPAPVAANSTRGRTVKGKRVGSIQAARYRSASGIAPSSLPSFAAANPNAYLINNTEINVDPLHANGFTGDDVIVAVIDSGIRPGFPHLDLDGSVIGGFDLVGDGNGFSNVANDGHGTFAAGMISANVAFDMTGSSFLNSIMTHAPAAVLPGGIVPMLGSAPLSDIYAVRVFGTDANVGAPESRVLAAIQHVIERREAFDRGQPGGLKIEVCNLSLGNATLIAGRDLLDQSVDALMEHGIIPVVSAGNTGPSSLTTASPGSSFSAITVGAANRAASERIMRDLQFGLGIGSLYRPFSGTQTASFSSRGPNADGRIDPDVMANGVGNFGQGFDVIGSITLASGTSFSTPTVAGVAAVLRHAFPRASAIKIRNAIVMSGNSGAITDGSTELDRGRGIVNAQAAYMLLRSGDVPDELPKHKKPHKSVAQNVEQSTDLKVRHGNVQGRISNLRPGQRADILYFITSKTNQVVVSLTNFTPSLPPSQQNQLFGDDILFAVHSAKTSSVGAFGDYLAGGFTTGGTFVINDPEPGIMRITINGDWTNAGDISTDVTVTSTREALPGTTTQGKISDGETIALPLTIPSGVKVADFRLEFEDNWGNYPTSDIDLLLVDPKGTVNQDGATLNDPEVVSLANPIPGAWLVVIHGFDVPAGTDTWDIRIQFDGKLVK